MAWEMDWSNLMPGNANKVWARNPTAHTPKTREWHYVSTYYLTEIGVYTPVYRKDSWEVDWSKRNGKLVWAHNPLSKMPTAREWHWVEFGTLQQAGIPWKPKNGKTGRYVNSQGYVHLTRQGMTQEEVELADRYKLWRGKRQTFVKEHHLVALKRFGYMPEDFYCVRHLDGNKQNNSPDNLVFGTCKENCYDHETARRMAMHWRNRYDEAKLRIAELENQLFILGVDTSEKAS